MSVPYGESPGISREVVGFQSIASIQFEHNESVAMIEQAADILVDNASRELMGEGWTAAARSLYDIIYITETAAQNARDNIVNNTLNTLTFGDPDTYTDCKKVLEIAAAGTGMSFTGYWNDIPIEAVAGTTADIALTAWEKDEPLPIPTQASHTRDLYDRIKLIGDASRTRHKEVYENVTAQLAQVGNDCFGKTNGSEIAIQLYHLQHAIDAEDTSILLGEQSVPHPIRAPVNTRIDIFAHTLSIIAKATSKTRVGYYNGYLVIVSPDTEPQDAINEWYRLCTEGFNRNPYT